MNGLDSLFLGHWKSVLLVINLLGFFFKARNQALVCALLLGK